MIASSPVSGPLSSNNPSASTAASSCSPTFSSMSSESLPVFRTPWCTFLTTQCRAWLHSTKLVQHYACSIQSQGDGTDSLSHNTQSARANSSRMASRSLAAYSTTKESAISSRDGLAMPSYRGHPAFQLVSLRRIELSLQSRTPISHIARHLLQTEHIWIISWLATWSSDDGPHAWSLRSQQPRARAHSKDEQDLRTSTDLIHCDFTSHGSYLVYR